MISTVEKLKKFSIVKLGSKLVSIRKNFVLMKKPLIIR